MDNLHPAQGGDPFTIQAIKTRREDITSVYKMWSPLTPLTIQSIDSGSGTGKEF